MSLTLAAEVARPDLVDGVVLEDLFLAWDDGGFGSDNLQWLWMSPSFSSRSPSLLLHPILISTLIMNPAAFLTRNSAESLLKEEKNAVEGRLLPKLAQQHKYSVFFPSLCSFILSFSFSFPPPCSSCSLCSFEFCCLLSFSIKIVLSDFVFDFSNSFSPF